MTIKLGSSTEINTVAIIEPYGDDLKVVPDESSGPWVRPSHWLDMPVINSGEQKCAFLFAVPSGETMNNYFKIYAQGINQGNVHTDFTIDWGDGNTHVCNSYHSIYASEPDEFPEHIYDFNDLDPNTQFEDGGAIYRQALIQFDAPLSGIQIFQWKYTHSYPGSYRDQENYTLDYHINLPSGTSSDGNIYGSLKMPLLERVKFNMPKITNMANYFHSCYRLRSVDIGPFDNLTECRGLFAYCRSLDYVPYIDTSNAVYLDAALLDTGITEYDNDWDISNGVRIDSLLNSCRNLKSVNIDISSNTTRLYNVFSNCHNLERITGNWDTSNVTNFQQMCYNSKNLVYVPKEINFLSATSLRWSFQHCQKLRNHFVIDAPLLNDGEYAFSACRSIKKITIKDLSNPNAYNYRYMFNSCDNLRTVNIINPNITSSYQGLAGFFGGCYNLEYVPTINTSGVNNLSVMFNGCTKLKKVENMPNTSSVTNFDSMFYDCVNLEKSPVLDITANGVGDVNTRRMFINCNSLKEFPDFDYSRVYYAPEMFSSCKNATGILNLDLRNMTLENGANSYTTNNMFTSCSNLRKVGQLIMPVSGYFSNMFNYSGLQSMPYVDASQGYNYNSMFNYTYFLNEGALSGVDVSIGYYRSALPSGAVTRVIEGLASGVVGQTLNMTEVPGAQILHPDTISIATSKGWTVTT